MFRSLDEVAKIIDYTNVKPIASIADITRLVEETEKYGFYGICVSPIYVKLVRDLIRKDVKVISVVSFPFGTSSVKAKIDEGCEAISDGADELDIVSCLGYVKSRRYDLFQDEIETIVSFFRREYPDIIVKIIVDVPYLSFDECRAVADVINDVKPHYFKTSTGYAPRGTTIEDVKMFRELLSSDVKIKAAGGIRSFRQVVDLVFAGASRIGTSTAIRIIEEAKKEIKGGRVGD